MRNSLLLGLVSISAALFAGPALSGPVTTLPSLSSNGTGVYGVYISSEAGDTLTLSEVSPNSVSNMFCNHSFGGCTASSAGQVVDLGATPPGVAFSLTDNSVANVFRTDALAADGYSHALASMTVDASDPNAVATAYGIFGQGQLPTDAAASIALLGQVAGTSITFVGWEDRLYGDFDYNDLIFAFTDPPVVSADASSVPEPASV